MILRKLNAFLAASITLVAGLATSSLYAGKYTWTGGGNDGLWTTLANWGGSGYPNASDAEVIFNSSATVSLDTGAQTDIAYIKVTAGNVVLTPTEGSSLKLNWPGNGNPESGKAGYGVTIAEGASLDLSAPLATIDGRFDRYGTGKLTVRDIAIEKTSNPNLYLYNGTNSFEGSVSVTLPSGGADVVVGVGDPYDRSCVFIKDNAQFTVRSFSLSAGGKTVPNTKVVQDGAGTVVTASNELALNCNSANDDHRYTLKSGTLSAKTLSVAYHNEYRSQDHAPEHVHYVQEGGTSTFGQVSLINGSAVLRGGVMNVPAVSNIAVGAGCAFGLEGGTLALTNAILSTWDWSDAKFAISPGASVAIVGSSSLSIPRSCSTYEVGLEIGAGKTVAVSSGAKITAPRCSTNPWKVTLNNGSTLKLNDSLARLAVPLDLTVNGTGKILFGGHRGAVIAHRLTVDGTQKAKGRYSANGGHSFIANSADAASIVQATSILVPHVWTGAGADDNWNTAENWEGNDVPNSSTAVADISRATSITLNSAVSLTALVAIPNGMDRKVTVTGTGSITMYSGSEYDTGLVVTEGCELVMGVDFKRGNDTVQEMVGGGKVTFQKNVTICKNGGGTIWAVDGTFCLSGGTPASYASGNTVYGSMFSSNGRASELLIEDGTAFSINRMWASLPGYTPVASIRQTGGTTTYGNCWATVYNNGYAGFAAYYLDGGQMTVSEAIKLGPSNPSSTKRYPGGCFEMSGGTLTCNGFTSCKNQNYVRLYGGTVYLKGNMSAAVDTEGNISVKNYNDITYYFGGVTIHPTGAERYLSSGNLYLTGKNGDPVFDISDQEFDISSENTISGPGGFVVTATAAKTFYTCGTYINTGAIVLRGSAKMRFWDCTLNGPSKLVVESASAEMTIFSPVGQSTHPCTVSKDFDVIELAAASCLVVGGQQNVNTRRLVVGGVEYGKGTYRFGPTSAYGTVTVTGSAPESWVVDGAADLSWFADGTTTTVDAETTLSSLAYDPVMAGQTNALDGAALTFADGANIHVEKGATLVVGNDVVFAGKITKTGWGEVVFNGGVSAAVAATDGYWLTVKEGGATFDGAVTGVRLVTCGAQGATGVPVVTLKENCTVSDYAVVLTAWSEGLETANVTGETHQEGATVDYSAGVFSGLMNAGMCPLSRPNGGFGRYVLDSGTFKMKDTLHTSFFHVWNDIGSFEFVQNGGTNIVAATLYLARNTGGVNLSYELNGGLLELNSVVSGYHRSLNSIKLNGGTVKVGVAGNFCKREDVALYMSGTSTFETVSGVAAKLSNDAEGSGALVVTGAGSLALDGVFCLGGLDVQSGTVKIGDKLQSVLNGAADLSIAKTGATLDLDYDGEATFKTLTVGRQERGAGVYSATQGPAAVKNVLAGAGALRILKGSGPGSVILIR